MAQSASHAGFLNDGDGPPRAVRIAWLVTVGWWLALGTVLLGGLLCITIVGIPPGYWLLRRVLNVATLKHSVMGKPWPRVGE
ncbi:MAG TPA: YccF domain-containing protein [Tepidiformaceae bacterium]|nr:YccF domain-containing protein [Tepidiformaceae bacterium]